MVLAVATRMAVVSLVMLTMAMFTWNTVHGGQTPVQLVLAETSGTQLPSHVRLPTSPMAAGHKSIANSRARLRCWVGESVGLCIVHGSMARKDMMTPLSTSFFSCADTNDWQKAR